MVLNTIRELMAYISATYLIIYKLEIDELEYKKGYIKDIQVRLYLKSDSNFDITTVFITPRLLSVICIGERYEFEDLL